VQLKINNSDDHIYTFAFNLKLEQHYNVCFALLNMTNYGLFICTDDKHEFLSFEANFNESFSPQSLLMTARDRASAEGTYNVFNEVIYSFHAQAPGADGLWHVLEKMAPLDKQWYATITIGS
jgi:hypothetical protein